MKQTNKKHENIMNVNQALKRLKIMLSSQLKFAEATLTDGVEVYTEGELQEGAILFVRAGEGASEDPFAPAGMHETTDGKIITVGENGEVTKIEDKTSEEAEVEVKVEEEMEDVVVPVDVAPEVAAPAEDLLAGIAELIAPFTEEIAALQEEVVALRKRFEAMAAEPAAPRVKSTFNSILDERAAQTETRLKQLAAMRRAK